MKSKERVEIQYREEKEYSQNELKHIARYKFARKFAEGDILDISCGTGYGSKMLSNKGMVLAVDVDGKAIEFAKRFNASPNVKYLRKSIQKYERKQKFDTIVCLETFEHLPLKDGVELLKKIKSLLKSNGCVVLSTPMLRYRDGKPYVTNPFHVNEMPRKKFISKIQSIWKGLYIQYFHQNIDKFITLDDQHTGFLVVVGIKI